MSKKCIHHWVCEPPNGPTSEATCRTCNETAVFQNRPEWPKAYGKNGKQIQTAIHLNATPYDYIGGVF